MDIMAQLNMAKEKGASDLHLVVGSPPLLRIHGLLDAAADLAEEWGRDSNRTTRNNKKPKWLN